MRIPRGGLIPINLKCWGWRKGSSTNSRICAICFLQPPMSSCPTPFKFDSSSSRFMGSPSENQICRDRKVWGKTAKPTSMDPGSQCLVRWYKILWGLFRWLWIPLSACHRSVAFPHRSICCTNNKVSIWAPNREMRITLKEVGFRINIDNISAKTLDWVVKGRMCTHFPYLMSRHWCSDEVTEFDSQIVMSNLVHLNTTLLDIIGAQANEHSVASL